MYAILTRVLNWRLYDTLPWHRNLLKCVFVVVLFYFCRFFYFVLHIFFFQFEEFRSRTHRDQRIYFKVKGFLRDQRMDGQQRQALCEPLTVLYLTSEHSIRAYEVWVTCQELGIDMSEERHLLSRKLQSVLFPCIGTCIWEFYGLGISRYLLFQKQHSFRSLLLRVN